MSIVLSPDEAGAKLKCRVGAPSRQELLHERRKVRCGGDVFDNVARSACASL